jgi:hypothetical protein
MQSPNRSIRYCCWLWNGEFKQICNLREVVRPIANILLVDMVRSVPVNVSRNAGTCNAVLNDVEGARGNPGDAAGRLDLLEPKRQSSNLAKERNPISVA